MRPKEAVTPTEFLLARVAEDERWARAFRSSPAGNRILAECEAKRRIVDLHRPVRVDEGPAICGVCAGDGFAPCDTLRFLALPYADHPDYRQEWRP